MSTIEMLKSLDVDHKHWNFMKTVMKYSVGVFVFHLVCRIVYEKTIKFVYIYIFLNRSLSTVELIEQNFVYWLNFEKQIVLILLVKQRPLFIFFKHQYVYYMFFVFNVHIQLSDILFLLSYLIFDINTLKAW